MKHPRRVAVIVPFIVKPVDPSLPQELQEPLFLVCTSRRHKGKYVFPKVYCAFSNWVELISSETRVE